jgi:hypothetical protein
VFSGVSSSKFFFKSQVTFFKDFFQKFYKSKHLASLSPTHKIEHLSRYIVHLISLSHHTSF